MSESLWFNHKTGQWEPRQIITGEEFWTRYVYYQDTPFSNWRKKMVYEDDDVMTTIEHQLASMDRFPEAERIINSIKRNLDDVD